MLSPRTVRFGLLAVLTALIFSLLGALFLAPPAEAQGAILNGTLKAQGESVVGVVVVVSDSAGEEVGRATSGDDGKWEVPITKLDEYLVSIDVTSLPEGVGFKEGATNEVLKEIDAWTREKFPVGFRLEDGGAVPLLTIDPLWQRILQRAVSGLRVGLLVALAAVGLSLIYGVTGLVNFAHSEMVTFGAVTAFGFEAMAPSLPFVVPVFLGIMAGAALGFVLERGLFKPLRKRKMNNISLMIVSIGLAFVLRYLIAIYFGTEPLAYKHYLLQTERNIGPIALPPKDLVIMPVALFLLVLVGFLLQKTRIGTSMRAVADNPPLAESSGIDINKTILAVWIAGSALAAAGGIFLGLTNIVEWQMGEKLLLLIFAAVTLGGLGTAYGAIVGGLAIGMASEMTSMVPFLGPDFKFMVALVVLIVILLVRPQGILGVRERLG